MGVRKGIWFHSGRWLDLLAKFVAVIQPDFSTYQDFPDAIKIYNTYRMRTLGQYLVDNGITVIPNYRFGTAETYDYCCAGIPKNSYVAVSTVGCLKPAWDRWRFKAGLKQLVEQVSPKAVLVYGPAPKRVFDVLAAANIPYRSYATDYKRRIAKSKAQKNPDCGNPSISIKQR